MIVVTDDFSKTSLFNFFLEAHNLASIAITLSNYQMLIFIHLAFYIYIV